MFVELKIIYYVFAGGDVVSGNGLGSTSIFGGAFDDEDFSIKHVDAGFLSVANSGIN